MCVVCNLTVSIGSLVEGIIRGGHRLLAYNTGLVHYPVDYRRFTSDLNNETSKCPEFICPSDRAVYLFEVKVVTISVKELPND